MLHCNSNRWQSAFECLGNLISSYRILKYISSNLHPLPLFDVLILIIEKSNPDISWGINSKLLREGDARERTVVAMTNIIKMMSSTTTFSNPKECATWPINLNCVHKSQGQRWKACVIISISVIATSQSWVIYSWMEWVCYMGSSILACKTHRENHGRVSGSSGIMRSKSKPLCRKAWSVHEEQLNKLCAVFRITAGFVKFSLYHTYYILICLGWYRVEVRSGNDMEEAWKLRFPASWTKLTSDSLYIKPMIMRFKTEGTAKII